jgi:hypothetical protein
MFKSLKAGYEARNRALIDGHLKAMRRKFSGKIVLLDVSGQHKYMTAWAKKIGAYYVKADIAGDKVSDEQLKKALVELQTISSKVLGKPLSAAFDKKIESLLESKTQPKQTLAEHTTATQQEPESRKELYVVAALIALILAVCPYLFLRKGRKTADSGYEAVPAYTSLAAEQRQIEKPFSTADDTGNKDKLRFLRQVLENTHFDKRFTLGVPVPPGTMHVMWKDPSGKIRKSPVIDISINSLLFEEPEFTAGKIDAIECILFDKEMIVKSSLQETRENRLHAVILEDFDDNLGDRMHWIEILTRIEEVG